MIRSGGRDSRVKGGEESAIFCNWHGSGVISSGNVVSKKLHGSKNGIVSPQDVVLSHSPVQAECRQLNPVKTVVLEVSTVMLAF